MLQYIFNVVSVSSAPNSTSFEITVSHCISKLVHIGADQTYLVINNIGRIPRDQTQDLPAGHSTHSTVSVNVTGDLTNVPVGQGSNLNSP